MEHSHKMKQIKVFVSVLLVLCVGIVCVIIGKKIYDHYNHHETIVYSNSSVADNENSELYNTKPVSDAYLSGDTSRLSDLDKKIYDTAAEILDKIITDEMSEYEKELAIHDYIVTNTTYDVNKLGVFQDYNENSDNPYGTLVNGKAICWGYTSTFKMFMDMLEIPNIVVFAQDSDNDDHAWNMVQLDNEWYYVDVTWDDPTPDEENRPALHKYFNVTEEFLKNNRHVWDSTNLPEADSTTYSYENMTQKSSQESAYEIQTLY